MLALVFAGERRVWRVAGICAVPLVALILAYCLRPRPYITGSDSVEVVTYVAPTPAGARVCVPGLEIPAGTARVRLQLISRTQERAELHMTLSTGARTLASSLPPTAVQASRISTPTFSIPELPAHPAYAAATLCLTAGDLVNWGGTPLSGAPPHPPTLQGKPFPAQLAVWYLPPAGAQSSYLARAGAILSRASLFRPGAVGPWLYWLALLLVLPGLALASIRCLAVALACSEPGAAGSGPATGVESGGSESAIARCGPRGPRRLAAWLFAIAALNFMCWALITPPFQAPDEIDHFAYTQSLVERGEGPARSAASPLPRWSNAEDLVLQDMNFFTDHQVGDTTMPWAPPQEREYLQQVSELHSTAANGGGYETASPHGPIYYAALAPAYAVAGSSPLAQLTLMRLASALIGALAVLFAFLLVRELAPGRAWLAVLAALLVAYEPMYGFISGAVNNDVGVNAGAAALLFLLFRMARRGVTLPWGLLTGGLLILLPIVKGTALSLYPIAGLALAISVWRHHRRRADVLGWVGLALGALIVHELSLHLSGTFHPVATGSASTSGATAVVGLAREHPLGFLAYLWELFLPRLPFMAPHFPGLGNPAFTIFVKRGWAAFGWYDVLFAHWVYVVVAVAMTTVPLLGLVAIRREWPFVRRNALDFGLLVATPLAVMAGFEAAFYTVGTRPFLPEFGRYEFPAIICLAALVVAALHAFGRRWVLPVGVGLAVAMIALSYAAQLLTLTTFYA
jgi:4-amino-4-deoxy-L-arabinose transferase-like glycosyltransferase